ALGLGPALVTVSVEDADSNVYQLDAGSLPADGRDHALTVGLGPDSPAAASSSLADAVYPLRLSALSVNYTLPAARPRVPAVLTLDGVSGPAGQVAGTALHGWPAVASSAELAGVRQLAGTAGPSAPPSVSSAAPAGTALAVTFQPGYGLAASGFPGVPPSMVGGQLTLTPDAPGVIPGLATQRFLSASSASVGSTVQANIDGAIVIVKI